MSQIRKTAISLFLFAVIVCSNIFVISVSAITPRFAGEEFPTYEVGNNIQVCDAEKITLVAEAVGQNKASFDACIVHGKDLDLAYVYGTKEENAMPLVRMKGQTSFSRLRETTAIARIVPGTNTVIYQAMGATVQVKDFTKDLSPNQVVGNEVYDYNVESGADDRNILAIAGSSSYMRPSSFRVSGDGAYLFAYVDDAGVIKYDLRTDQAVALFRQSNNGSSMQDKLRIEAVSDDGRFVFIGPQGEIVDTRGCGDKLEGRLADATLQHSCYRRYMGNITEKVASAAAQTNGGTFSTDNHNLSFFVRLQENNKVTLHHVRVPVPGVKQITYLALGDSFASGEGNLNKSGPGYHWGTDVNGSSSTPKEKCHLSELSYPFLLANKMSYGEYAIDENMNWSSVACSGAVINDVSGRESLSYEGQKRDNNISRLRGFDVLNLKTEALSEMTPGRQKQIEFIRRYQPKAVTLSIGGNDAQFADTIKACVQPIGGGGTEWTSTCSYAKDDGKKANIAYTIFALRNKLMDVYQELLDAGPPGMKLYVVGYPILVDKNPSNATCGMSVRLNNNEREMVIESTKLLNMMARSAADDAGAIFISTENNFGESVLCGSSSKKAVNGIVLNDTSASFHPNPYGHELMAKRIEDALNDSSLDTYICHDSYYVTCPGGETTPISMPDYFKQAIINHSRALNDQNIVGSFLRGLANVPVAVGSYIYGANSPVSIIWYSDPQNIGTFQTSADGSLNVIVSLPSDTPSGYHTLEIQGTGVDGQPLTLWKIVEVENPNNPDEETVSAGSQIKSEEATKAIPSGGIIPKSLVANTTDIQEKSSNKAIEPSRDLASIDEKGIQKNATLSNGSVNWAILASVLLGSLVGILTIGLIIRKYKGTR